MFTVGRISGCFALLSLFSTVLCTQLIESVKAQESSISQKQEVIEAAKSRCLNLVTSKTLMSNLTNPAFTQVEQVRETQIASEMVHLCIQLLKESQPENKSLASLDLLASYFITFAGSRENSILNRVNRPRKADNQLLYALNTDLVLVNLEESKAPAIVELREQVGLPAPKGFFYIRFFPENQIPYLPDFIQNLFNDPNTQGGSFAYGSGRYIAVKLSKNSEDRDSTFIQNHYDLVINHELVHAYIFSQIPYENVEKLPRWFYEGCATYFSGSSHLQVARQRSGKKTIIEAPVEYQRYDFTFDYLESKLGQAKLYQLIRDAIKEQQIDGFFSAVGVSSDKEFFREVELWQSQRNFVPVASFLGGAVLICVALLFTRGRRGD